MKYGELNLGQMEAIVNKLGGMKGVNRFLRGEITISEPKRTWHEENGVIYFSVTSTGMTGEEWITSRFLEGKNFRVRDYATKSVLRSSDFKPTDGVTYEIAVLKGKLFSGSDRITKKIRDEADKRKLTKPNAEVACLIREKFTDKEIETMGLWGIVVMHPPIKDFVGDPLLLDADRGGIGWWIHAYCDRSVRRWSRGLGFAFVASQV